MRAFRPRLVPSVAVVALAAPAAAGLFLLVATAAEARPEPAVPSPAASFESFDLPAFWGPLKARWRPAAEHGRRLLLIGAGGRSLEGLDPLAHRLQQAGWSVLSIRNPVNILRRDGNGLPIVDKRRLSTGGIPDLVRDTESAVRFLAEQPASTDGIVLVAEGLGVPIAAHIAAADPRVVAVAFVTPAKECDPSATRLVLEKACDRKPALLVLGHKDEVYRAWFSDRQGTSPNLTVVDPLARPGGAEAEQAAWAGYEFPFVEDVVSWLKTLAPPARP